MRDKYISTIMMWCYGLWLVVAHDLLEYRYMEICFLCPCFVQHGARFWDYFGLMPRKKSSRSYLKRRKMEKRRQNELLTTWELLNYKKTSLQWLLCVVAMRDSLSPLFCFEQEKTLKNFRRNCISLQSKIKKKKKQGRKVALGPKLAQIRTVKQYEAGKLMCIGLFLSFFIIFISLFSFQIIV